MKKENIKNQARELFKNTKSVPCPAFPGEEIVFNSKGLSHLFYKGSQKNASRPSKEAEVRISLLPRAMKVLKLMPLAQEESVFVAKDGKQVKYWDFEAVVDDRRIKVIVRQIGNGKKHFMTLVDYKKLACGLGFSRTTLSGHEHWYLNTKKEKVNYVASII